MNQHILSRKCFAIQSIRKELITGLYQTYTRNNWSIFAQKQNRMVHQSSWMILVFQEEILEAFCRKFQIPTAS